MASLENETREEDIATLSPFDTSSPYTFLGSIMSDFTLSGAQSQNILQSSASTIGYLIQSPLRIMSHNASAESSVAEQNCSYASVFGVEEDIAINAAGYPCVGIPSAYLDMSRSKVMSLVADDIDPETGEPKDESDIMLMMSDCSEGSLESVSGCSIEVSSSSVVNGTFDEQKRAAQSLYMLDYQVEKIISGEDTIAASDETYADMLANVDYKSVLDDFLGEYYSTETATEMDTDKSVVVQTTSNVLTVNNTCEQPEISKYTASILGGILPRLGIV